MECNSVLLHATFIWSVQVQSGVKLNENDWIFYWFHIGLKARWLLEDNEKPDTQGSVHTP